MADITTFPTEATLTASDRPILGGERGPIETYTAAAAIKGGQVVVYISGTSGSVTPATGATSEKVAGVALYNVASGGLCAVAQAGCIVKVVNADDTTAINPGAWIQTNDSRGSGGGNTAFNAGIQAAATDAGTQRVFTESLLKDVLQLCWENGGEPTMLMVGAFNKKQVSGFSGIADNIRDTGNKRATIVGAADVYVSDFGTLNVIANRFSRSRSALVVDPSMWKLCYYQPYKTEALSKTGHADREMLSVEFTLEACNEKASGVVADLTTS